MAVQVRNPTTGEIESEWEHHDAAAVEERLASAAEAFSSWRQASSAERARVLRTVADGLEERADAYAGLMAREMGKPLADGRAEVEKCAWAARHYAENGEAMLAPRQVETDARRSFVRCDPLGVVLSIMPWNFPFWQTFRFVAPALMAGNTVLLKHAQNTLGCGEAIEELIGGVRPGLLRHVIADHERVAEIIADERVRAVTVTGSERAGRSVAATAGQHLKKTVLELGGSDPFVVFADADVAAAGRTAAQARLLNAGQSCIAAKRFIVEEAVAERFLAVFREALSAARTGDPTAEGTEVGPLAREDLREALHDQVERTVRAGATCVLGGEIPTGRGFFYPPTILTGVRPGMAAWDEETFGPVAAVRVVKDAEEAIAAANDSRYGLGASIWTRNGEAVAPRIEAGLVFVNGLVKSDPRIPFGGVKASGYGRELGDLGIHEFVNHKSVWIA